MNSRTYMLHALMVGLMIHGPFVRAQHPCQSNRRSCFHTFWDRRIWRSQVLFVNALGELAEGWFFGDADDCPSEGFLVEESHVLATLCGCKVLPVWHTRLVTRLVMKGKSIMDGSACGLCLSKTALYA